MLETGHNADILAIEEQDREWKASVEAQLKHIISTAQNELSNLQLTHDVFGNEFKPGENKVSIYALDAIEACVRRIKEGK